MEVEEQPAVVGTVSGRRLELGGSGETARQTLVKDVSET